MTPYDSFRQFISPFLSGVNADALLNSLADEGYKGEQLSQAVGDQLTISTSSGLYLDKVLAQIGFSRPPDVGIADDAFSKLGIAQNAVKLVSTIIQQILEIFYGPQATRAFTLAGQPGPYQLADGDTLTLVFEDGIQQTITFLADDFSDINQATATEIAAVITSYMRDIGYPLALALPYTDPVTQLQYVQIFGCAQGPWSQVIVTGGQAQTVLEFPLIRNTDLEAQTPPEANNTVWQITQNYGTTIRFRWDGGNAPLLNSIKPGDTVLIYGPQFASIGLAGSFVITAVSPAQVSAGFASGWFEFHQPTSVGLLYSQPNIAPPFNSPGQTYSFNVSQVLYTDLMFFYAQKNTAYSKVGYALAFEPARQLLKIYMPATTTVVERSLVGAAYVHMLYPSSDFNGVFGSATDPTQQVQIVNDFALRYPMQRLDNYGTGGTVTAGLSVIPIDYIDRSDDEVTIYCAEPHGLVGYNEWTMATNYTTGDVIWREGFNYIALQNSGPGYGGAQDPVASLNFWRLQGPGYSLLNETITVSVETVQQDDALNPYPGPYLADPTTTFTLTNYIVSSRQFIEETTISRTVTILGTLPQQTGYLIFDLNQNTQEQPVPFIAVQQQGAPVAVDIQSASQIGNEIVVTTTGPHGVVPGDQVVIAGASPMNGTFTVASTPSNTVYVATNPTSQTAYATSGTSLLIAPGVISTVILDPTYEFKYSHQIGGDITLLSAAQTYVPAIDGSDYPLYITATADARIYAQQVIQNITAAGINMEIIIVYPNDIGLGNAGDGEGPALPVSDEVWVWGA